jgi:hypothetical protein
MVQYYAESFWEKVRKWALTRPTYKPDTSTISVALVISICNKEYQQRHSIAGIPVHCRKGKKWLLLQRKCRYSGEVAKTIAPTYYEYEKKICTANILTYSSDQIRKNTMGRIHNTHEQNVYAYRFSVGKAEGKPRL